MWMDHDKSATTKNRSYVDLCTCSKSLYTGNRMKKVKVEMDKHAAYNYILGRWQAVLQPSSQILAYSIIRFSLCKITGSLTCSKRLHEVYFPISALNLF